MAKAEFAAPHTFAFAGAYLMTVGAALLVERGFAGIGAAGEFLIMTVLGTLWALLAAALFSLGCAWGGFPRPKKVGWACAWGAAIALGFLIYAAIDRASPPPTNLEQAKEQYSRGTMGVAYTLLAPVLAGLITAWISKRAR